MTVISTTALRTENAASQDGHRTYTSYYRVITNDKDDGTITVRLTSNIPVAGSYYVWNSEYDLYAFRHAEPAVKLESEDQAFRRVWMVTVVHSTQAHSRNTGGQFQLPWQEPWQFSRDADEWVEEATKDKNGDPIVNSALEPITGKLVEVFRTRANLELSKNLTELNQSRIDETENRVNSSTVNILGVIYPKRTLRIRRIRATRRYSGLVAYYPHTFSLETKPDKFNTVAEDWGYRQRKASLEMPLFGDGAPTKFEETEEILDTVTKHPVRTPQPLNGAGVISTTGKPATLPEKEIYEEADLNVWEFPTMETG